MIECEKCGKCPSDQSLIEFHHIVPKSIGGEDKDGRIYLCGKCHNIIVHIVVMKTIWDYVSDKENCKKDIVKKTIRWIG